MTIYFAVARTTPTGPVKIGYTTDLKARISGLSVGMPGGITVLATLPGGIETEQYLHERFAGCRRSGEWFDLTDELRQFIQDVQNKKPGLVPFVEPGASTIRRSPAEIAADCVAEAKEILAFLLGQEFRGIGDTIEASMHRLEMKHGIPFSISHRVRHRAMSDMLVSNYFVIKEAYDAELAKDAGVNEASSRLYRLSTRLVSEDDRAAS